MSQPHNKVGVLLPLVFRKAFDYRLPEGVEARPGDYVQAPFGNKSVWGVVWGEAQGNIDEKKIKTLSGISAHIPPMSEAMRKFIDWVAWYTLAPAGQVLKMALSAPEALEAVASCRLQVAGTDNIKRTPARARILAYLADGEARTAKEIATHAKVSPNVIREFIKAGGLTETLQPATCNLQPFSCDPQPATCNLSPIQSAAAASLRGKLGTEFSVTVLDGVTGSGKTEVYFDTIAETLRKNRQALVMLPEIALSVQWLARFEKRFGFAPDVWHSSVSPARRRKTWRGIADGTVHVVVGARSALFLPFLRLGLIVADEEHDASYKQEEGVIYQARDMAVARARHENIPALLVSATPSLETEFNIEHKRYSRVHLPLRHNDADMPVANLIDMRKISLPSNRWVSEPLKAALAKTLAARHQAVVFMNRRGYAPLMLCRACGYRCQCPHCSVYMVLHRSKGALLCHHCGHRAPVPRQCPDCKKEDCLIPYGPGVERVAEELRALFPQARVAVMASDSIAASGKWQVASSKNSEENNINYSLTSGHLPLVTGDIITAMTNHEIDILVGTQMIAKGHHFAGLALVGVVDADMGLAGGDLRAGERTYQLLHQLSGRAGREKTKGEVYLQTYMPEHPVMQALLAGDRDRFMLLEARMREDAEMPPYGKLAAIVIEGSEERQVAEFARELVKAAGKEPCNLQPAACAPLILGPAPAPLARIRNKYRYRILVKAERSFPMQQFLSGWALAHKIPAALKLKVDVEPYSFV
jgi:primosomal protein N' (replication factor Y)